LFLLLYFSALSHQASLPVSPCWGELTSRTRVMANGVKFGRKPKLSEYQRTEALKRRAAGETLAEIAKSYAVDVSMISRLR
jgi:hypothetical protein